jgi:PD-(D/E)XK endonuclease
VSCNAHLEKRWVTSRPTRDCRYDLVLDDGERLYRVQVKYAGRQAWNCAGAVSLDFTKGGRRDRTYLDHEIDAVIAYVAPADMLVWLGREHFHGRRNVQLRYVPTRSGQKAGCLMVTDVAWKTRDDEAPSSNLGIPTNKPWSRGDLTRRAFRA